MWMNCVRLFLKFVKKYKQEISPKVAAESRRVSIAYDRAHTFRLFGIILRMSSSDIGDSLENISGDQSNPVGRYQLTSISVLGIGC